jgi:hypothetical protein
MTVGWALERYLDGHSKVIEYAHDPGLRLISQFTRVLFSDNYSELPRLVDQFDVDYVAAVPDVLDIDYVLTTLLLMGRWQTVLEFAEDRIRRDPLSALGYNQAWGAALLAGDPDRADGFLDQADVNTGGGVLTEYNTIMARLVANQVNEAVQLAEKPHSGWEELRRPLLALVYAVSGRADDARMIVNELLEAKQVSYIMLALALQELGDLTAARRLIGDIDSSPAGVVQFIYVFKEFGGAMPFDVEWAPNFSARLAEAGITVERFEFPRTSGADNADAMDDLH